MTRSLTMSPVERTATWPPVVSSSVEPSWFAVYTSPRHERAVARHLESKGVEVFLPSLVTVNQWKDRKVRIEIPAFPGYVFTRIGMTERLKVVSVPGVVRVLSFNGLPAAIDDAEIQAIRLCLTRGVNPAPYPFMKTGERVRVKSGALEGVEGLVVRRKNDCRLVISVSLISQAVAVEIDAAALEPHQP